MPQLTWNVSSTGEVLLAFQPGLCFRTISGALKSYFCLGIISLLHYCEPITKTETNYGTEVLFWFVVSAGYQSIMVGRHMEFLAIGVYGRVSTDYGGPESQVSGVPMTFS